MVQNLHLCNCALTSQKLRMFADHSKRKCIKIPELNLSGNKDMDTIAYEELGAIIENVKVDVLRLDDCDLSSAKLRYLSKGLHERSVRMKGIVFNNNNEIEPEGFRYITEIVESVHMQQLCLSNCNLSSDSLAALAKHLRGRNTEMEALVINNNKTIMPEDFRHVTEILNSASIEALCLEECDLTVKKLQGFRKYLDAAHLKLPELVLSNNQAMNADAYPVIVEILELAQVERFALSQCKLTNAKLEALHTSMKRKATALKLKMIALDQNPDIEPEGFACIAKILENTEEIGLKLCECELSTQKLCALTNPLIAKNIMISELDLTRPMAAVTNEEFIILFQVLQVVSRTLILIGWELPCHRQKELQNGIDNHSSQKVIIFDQGQMVTSRSELDGVEPGTTINCLNLAGPQLNYRRLIRLREIIRDMDIKV